jgi:LysR family transcriptional regulator, low CO2-responsive transcriptional regulator
VVSTAKYFAPRLLAQFLKLHGGLEFKLTVHNRAEIIDQLQSYAVDLGIMGQPPEGMPLDGTSFAPNPLVAIAAPSHPLSLRRGLRPDDLTAQPFIVREPGSGTRSAMDRYFSDHGVRIRHVMEADSNETIKQAVMAGIGLGFLSLHTVRAELAAGRIATLDVFGLPLQRQWYVVHSSQRRLTPAAEEFRQYLLREADALMRAAL